MKDYLAIEEVKALEILDVSSSYAGEMELTNYLISSNSEFKKASFTFEMINLHKSEPSQKTFLSNIRKSFRISISDLFMKLLLEKSLRILLIISSLGVYSFGNK